MCYFRVNGRPILHIFHRFQNAPESYECNLRVLRDFQSVRDFTLYINLVLSCLNSCFTLFIFCGALPSDVTKWLSERPFLQLGTAVEETLEGYQIFGLILLGHQIFRRN